MRLWSWLTPKLASVGRALAGFRLNPRALVFAVACALIFSGVSSLHSPAAARCTLGLLLLVGLLWPEPRREKS
jgi:hypothetical protein